MGIIERIFGQAEEVKRTSLNEIDVRFHKEAFLHTVHGYLVVTNRQLGIKEAPVAFAFPNYSKAPVLDQRLIVDLWEAAKAQGYIPHRLDSYGAIKPMASADVANASPARTSAFAAMQGQDRAIADLGMHPERHAVLNEQAVAGRDMTDAALATSMVASNYDVPAYLRRDLIDSASAAAAGATPDDVRYSAANAQITSLRANYEDRLGELPVEKQDEVASQIEQVVTNGRAVGREHKVIMGQVTAVLEDAVKFVDAPAGVGTVSLRFPRLDPNRQQSATH
ncbi:hypothetical protein [Paraburkholderia sp. BCC1886]|uniref:hypothetical protein n=1 Tax=Paraburkholderia sp. BCC1886 TaxID=2562670 RepID=UPI0011844AD3|nr:hypothetical protein [Paraburkholderia sp. BCC1886]